MKKILMTLMLAIVSGGCMTNAASGRWCLPSYRTDTEPWIEVSGTFQMAGYPCDPDLDEVCADCITIVLKTDDGIYYLVSDNGQVIEQLDNVTIGMSATVAGIPFTRGIHKYIQVSKITQDQAPLPSLCDEWNVLIIENAAAGDDITSYSTCHYRLKTDTIISEQQYFKLKQEDAYRGALREKADKRIYYIPAGSTHEYLLYAFNAHEGESLNNVWIGGTANQYPNGTNVIVEEIKDTDPRTFVLSTGWTHTDEGIEVAPFYFEWIEGVGLSSGPTGRPSCVGCAGGSTQVILCAYKNGEQVYISAIGKEYGCEYYFVPPTQQSSDTVPVYRYTGDDPGSSTVDPVDPNQVVVTLKGDELTIKESSGDEINFKLTNTSVASSAARAPKTDDAQSFRNEVSVQLTEDGNYQLILTNPNWDYKIYGTFRYAHQGLGRVNDESSATKILRDGQVLIERNGRVYSLTGMEIK